MILARRTHDLLNKDILKAYSQVRQILTTENPLKMMKMFFISPQMLFSFSRYFILTFWSSRKTVKVKIRLVSKFMTPRQASANPFEYVYKSVCAALTLGVQNFTLLFLDVAIQNCPGKQGQRFLELKNRTCYYHKFRENYWKINVKEFSFGKAFSL